jgi:S-adenosylmethionine uptake transporter
MQALWMVLASFFFAAMSVCVKFAATHFNTFELVCYRGAIGTLIMVMVCQRKNISLQTPVLKMHVVRSIAGVVSLAAWFYAIAKLPLATAMTLNYTSSVWVAAFLVGSTMWIGTFKSAARQVPVAMTVLLGFVGVVMTLRPSFEQNQFAAGIIGVVSGMVSAIAYLQVAALGKVGEPVERTVFYFSLGSAVAGALCMLVWGTSEWVWTLALWLLPVGILAVLGQWCMTQAYNDGATLVVANLQYSCIVFSAVFGLFLFGDEIPWMGWAGIGVIVLSGIAATAFRQRSVGHIPAQ